MSVALKAPEVLLRHRSEKDKKSFNEQYVAAAWVLSEIAKYLDGEYKKLLKEDESLTNYELPAYSEKKADNAGERRRLNKVLSLLPDKSFAEIEEEEKKERERGTEIKSV